MSNGPTPREGNTLRELAEWTKANPDDPSLARVASFVTELVTQWQAGQIGSGAVLHAMNERFEREWRSLSDPAAAVLNQGQMWFVYEATVSDGTFDAISSEYLV